MDYALLWIEILLISLLVTAVGFVNDARSQSKRIKRLILGSILWALPLYIMLCVLSGLWKFKLFKDSIWFYFFIVLTACYLVGAVILCVAGFKRKKDNPTFPAASWSKGFLYIAQFITVSLLVMTIWMMDLQARRQQDLIRIEAGMLGLSLAPPHVPDNENAASFYIQANQAIQRAIDKMPLKPIEEEAKTNEKNDVPRTQRDWDKSTESLDQHSIDLKDPELLEFLRQQTPTLKLIYDATKKPSCYLYYNYSQPCDYWHEAEINTYYITKLLAIEARSKAANGDIHSAIEAINAIYGFAKHIDDEPFGENNLHAFQIDQEASNSLIFILASEKIEQDDLNKIKLECALQYQKSLIEALRFKESSFLYHLSEIGYTRAFGVNQGPNAYDSFIFRFLFLDNEVKALRSYADHFFILASDPFISRISYWKDDAKKIKESPKSFLASIYYIDIDDLAVIKARAEAYRTIAELVLATCRYRAKKVKYPEKLDDLVPDFIAFVPVDPFDGQQIRYKISDKKATIYSVGKDGVDDGGIPTMRKPKKATLLLNYQTKGIRD